MLNLVHKLSVNLSKETTEACCSVIATYWISRLTRLGPLPIYLYDHDSNFPHVVIVGAL